MRKESMSQPSTDRVFSDAMSVVYDTHLVPLIFEPYAADMATRLAARSLADVLETAAGSGAVTRALAAALPAHVRVVATDLSAPMLERAAAVGTARPVEWRQADAMALPYPASSFDAVVCQFGAMFFPDKPAAFAEARRVLRPGGTFMFSVWDRIEENDFAAVVTEALGGLFPESPPLFLARTPHGYHSRPAIERDLAAAGFTRPGITTLHARSRAASPHVVAIAYCLGTPLRREIEAQRPPRLDQATAVAGEAIARRFGRGPVDGKLQAHVIVAEH
jgi:SAM-dependent methyltransferase